jgi:VanZ like family/Concanavalin A-like lectin/glucanases superfamily
MRAFHAVSSAITKSFAEHWGSACFAYLLVITIAGLWPFNPFPRNDVTWLEHRNGLRFGPAGVVMSSANFQWPAVERRSECSLELYLEPYTNPGSNSILTFYTPETPQGLRIFEWRRSVLLIYKDIGLPHREIDVEHAFRPGRPVFIAITSGLRGTFVYLDGKLAGRSHALSLSPSDLSGQMILGTSPVTDANWTGEVRRLAIYDRQLTNDQVSRHFDAWITAGSLETSRQEGGMALYTFREHSGRVVHDDFVSAPDLDIPKTFQIPHKPILLAPWKEFEWSRSYAQDVVINIVGFAPFGFFLCAYFTLKQNARWAAAAALSLGVITSVAIEVLQVWLPTRSSSATDVITNTIGTALGVCLYRTCRRYGKQETPCSETPPVPSSINH